MDILTLVTNVNMEDGRSFEFSIAHAETTLSISPMTSAASLMRILNGPRYDLGISSIETITVYKNTDVYNRIAHPELLAKAIGFRVAVDDNRTQRHTTRSHSGGELDSDPNYSFEALAEMEADAEIADDDENDGFGKPV